MCNDATAVMRGLCKQDQWHFCCVGVTRTFPFVFRMRTLRIRRTFGSCFDIKIYMEPSFTVICELCELCKRVDVCVCVFVWLVWTVLTSSSRKSVLILSLAHWPYQCAENSERWKFAEFKRVTCFMGFSSQSHQIKSNRKKIPSIWLNSAWLSSCVSRWDSRADLVRDNYEKKWYSSAVVFEWNATLSSTQSVSVYILLLFGYDIWVVCVCESYIIWWAESWLCHIVFAQL